MPPRRGSNPSFAAGGESSRSRSRRGFISRGLEGDGGCLVIVPAHPHRRIIVRIFIFIIIIVVVVVVRRRRRRRRHIASLVSLSHPRRVWFVEPLQRAVAKVPARRRFVPRLRCLDAHIVPPDARARRAIHAAVHAFVHPVRELVAPLGRVRYEPVVHQLVRSRPPVRIFLQARGDKLLERVREAPSNRGGGFFGMKKSTRMGCRSLYGGVPLAASIAVMPSDQMSLWSCTRRIRAPGSPRAPSRRGCR